MNKSKIVVAITIGLMSFMMIYIMMVQINIVNEYDGEEIEIMREAELKTTLAAYKEKYEEANNELIDTKAKIEEYKKDEKTEEDAIKLLEEEVEEANMLLGKTDVKGQGIIITLDNGEEEGIELTSISTEDLVELINELKLAGAEAISINEKRIIATSDIAEVGYSAIRLINNERTTAPYTIKAIGDIKYLQSALNIKGGYVDSALAYGHKIKIETQENMTIEKYKKDITMDYVKK